MSAATVAQQAARVAKDANLRALLLRLADGDTTFEPMAGLEEGMALASAKRRGLLGREHRLTALGLALAKRYTAVKP